MNYTDKLIVASPTSKTGRIGLRSEGQVDFVRSIRQHAVSFGYGPAGTGKTFLAVAAAMEALSAGDVNRIVMTRPAVEAGEKLGYLPGDTDEKVAPYLRPLIDSVMAIAGMENYRSMRTNHVLEVAPLAYMRGRTFNDTFMVLDEAQNTTPAQMQMYLTRMGMGSKNVIVGDPSQVDLDISLDGLSDALNRLSLTKTISITPLTVDDIQRHPVVQDIVDAYGRRDSFRPGKDQSSRSRNGVAT